MDVNVTEEKKETKKKGNDERVEYRKEERME